MSGIKRIPLWLRILFVLALIGAGGVALSIVPSTKVAVAPHEPIDIHGAQAGMRIGDEQPEPPHGHLFLVGVNEARVSLLSRFLLSFESSVTLRDASGKSGLDMRRDVDAINRSKQIAAAVAFVELGQPVGLSGGGAFVTHVDDAGPAQGVLEPGDRIVRINGKRVTTSVDVTGTISPLPEGSRITLGVRRDSLPRIVRITTVLPKPGDTLHRSRIGIAVNTPRLKIDLPKPVKINTRDVVGPSAGLVFALAVYDAESADDLLRGRFVVATGALSLEGEVLAVSGVRQKAIATQRAGHDMLIVPRANVGEAVDAIQEFCVEGAECANVLGVSSVHEALQLLKLDSRQLEAEFAN